MPVPTLPELKAIPDLQILPDEPMSRHTSFGIGGPADLLVLPHTPAAVAALLACCHAHSHRPLVIGNGTNLLVRDGGLRGVTLKIADNLSQITGEGCCLRAQAGASLAKLCVTAADCGLAGLSFVAGIPGTVGGAVYMNAGAWDQAVGSLVREVRTVDFAGRERCWPREELAFGYRRSGFQKLDLLVVEALFELQPGNTPQLHAELCDLISARCHKQPLSHQSAGSIFKRPPGDYAGRLIEITGGKGLQVGGAMISPKHANFIINTGGATARDVMALLELVRQRVHEHEGIWLETEVLVVGEEAASP